MKNKASIFGIYLPIFLAALLSSTVLRVFALMRDYDAATGYFADKTLITISDTILIVASVILLIFPILSRKNIRLIPMTGTPTLAVSLPVIVAAIFMTAHSARTLVLVLRTGAQTDRRTVMLAVCLAFGILTVLNFVFSPIVEKRRSAAKANLGITSAVFFACYSAYIYFDTSLPLNAPNKLVDQMAYLFLAVFFLYETRLSLGREKWRGYILFGMLTSLVTAYSAIPSIIYYLVNSSPLSLSVYESVLTLALFIFVITRTFLTGELTEDRISPKVQLLMDAATDRSAEIASNARVSEPQSEPDENEGQISIDDIDSTEEELLREEEEERQKLDLMAKLDELSTREDG